MTELEGQSLGQYRIIEQVAKGGMATVYRARQDSVNRDVAIKLLPRNFTHDDTFLERFYREVEIIAQLQHPHILPVYDFGEFDDMPYIVMAYLSGGTLGDRIKQGVLPPEEIIRTVRQVADALDFAHSKGIVHRDLKPGNVLLDERGNTYLADFGLARITEAASEITGTAIVGTPAYMAPEQSGPGDISPLIDVYALAVTIYQMLTSELPFDAPTATGILMAHVMQPIPDIRMARPDLPDSIQQVIEQGLAKEMPRRYQSAGKMATELIGALEGKSGAAESSGQQEVLKALLMTNMLGQVIFVDNQCLRILKRHQHEARNIIGKPMHQVLNSDRAVIDQLMADINNYGELNDVQIQIKDARDRERLVNCSAIATRDDDGKFVGVDITLELVPETGDTTPSDQFSSVQKPADSREENYLQAYFKSQVDAIHALLVQWAGKRIGSNLEDIINETGQRNVWPVSMHDGHITIELKLTETDVYRALLARAVSYAASIIGKSQVVSELKYINKNTDPAIMSYVQKLGMDRLYEDILN